MYKHVAAITFLFFLIFLFFSKEIFSPKRIFAPVDSIYLFSPWTEYKAVIPQNFQQTDALYQFIPWRLYAYQQIKKGNFPLWNPYEYGGIPFFSNDQSSVLSIFNTFGLIFSFDNGFLFINIFKLIICAIGMYLFLNLFALNTASCILGSIAYTFSALMITWLYHPLSSVTALLPWLFWAFEKLYQSVISSKGITFLFIASFILALSFFSGHSETTVNAMFGITVYLLTKIILDHKRIISIISLFIIALIVGFLLSAIQIVPFLQMLFNSVPFYNRSELLFNPMYTKVYLPLYSVFLWLVPNIIGNPSFSYFWMKIPPGLHEAQPYIGIAPLFLALLTIVFAKHNYKKTLPFWSMSFIGFGMAYGLPLIKWITMLPIIRAGGPFRYLTLAEFGLSALSAFGLDTLINRSKPADMNEQNLSFKPKTDKHSFSNPYKNLILLLLMISSITVILYWITRNDIALVATLFKNIAFTGALSRFNPQTIAFVIIQLIISILFIFSTLWIIIKAYSKQINGWIVPASFIILTTLDLFVFGIGYNPDVAKKDFYPSTPLINKLKTLDTKKYTFYAPDTIIPPDISMVYQLRDFRGYDIIPSIRYQNFLNLLFPNEYTNLGELGMLYWPKRPSLVLSSIAGIKYFIFPKDFNPYPQTNYLKLIGSYKDLSLWENTLALPIYYLAKGIQPAQNDNTALTLLSKLTTETIGEAIVEGIDKPYTYTPSSITINEIFEKPGEHIFNIQARAEGFLVLNEPFYTGWHAYINKKPEMLYHVNYLFQGIKLPKGNYEVEFKYNPDIFYTSLKISLVTLLISLFFLIAGNIRSNTKKFKH